MKLKNLMHRQGTRRSAVILVAAAVATAVAGTSYAYWTTTGSGSGSSSAGDMTIEIQALAVGDEAEKALYPGGNGNALVRVHNPNAFPVDVISVVSNGEATADCATPAVTFVDQTLTSPVTIAANSAWTLELEDAVSMRTTASDACQGKEIEVPVKVTVKR
jgi:hypothetical protein